MSDSLEWMNEVHWNADGLLPVIAQDAKTGTILMMAWMNAEALQQTVTCGEAVYWSRSRQRLWHKGESSGHVQKVHTILLDCDGDTLILKIEQIGGIACHTGRAHCFFKRLDGTTWVEETPVLKDPSAIYGAHGGKHE
ncbi:MAG: phosphoribosyl-AMP cyclohydrolase [Hahellaceae bacterium]|nr:phosphoribosyl-AMP cyclohydrolase [Hahellaceae bacterium]